MGTAGHSRLEEMIIGSNTEKVVRHARCPLLTVHPSQRRTILRTSSCYNLNADEDSFTQVVMNSRDMYSGTVHPLGINTTLNWTSR